MFNNFNLSNKEITKILNDYNPLIIKMSKLNNGFDDDLAQEMTIAIFKELSKNRKN